MSQTIVTIEMGGTGANSAAAARNAIGAAANTGGTFTGTVNTATANITTIVTGNALTLSTGTASNGNIIFSSNGTEEMRITNTGFIGIFTATPNSNLSIVGNVWVTTGVNAATVNATTSNAATFISSAGINVGAQAINAYGQANLAYAQANSAFGQANLAYAQANSARSDANTTFATVNTTFATLNTSAGTQNTNIGLAYDQANTARGQANTAYGQANAAYGQANAAYGAANTRLLSTGGTLSGDLIITGNLTVSGNQTILNTEVLTTEDAEIVLLSNTSGTPALNAGLIVNRGTSTNTFLRWDEAVDEWGWSDSGTTTYYLEDLRQGLITHNTTYGTINTTFGTVNTTFGTINTNYQAAYAQANTARTTANDAYGQANTARSDANTTFATINTTFATLNTSAGTQNTAITNAHDQANAARGQANTAYGQANLAYAQANSARSDANTTFATINTTFGTTNTTFATINTTFGTSNTSIGNRVLKAGDTMTGQLNISSGGLLVTGNVGLGTASPLVRLDVVGDTYVRSGTFFTDTIRPYSGSQLTVLNGSTNFLYINGNVGIGTTSSTAPLTVSGTSGDVLPVFRVNSTAAGSSFNWAASFLNSSLGSSRNTIVLVGQAESTRNSGYIGFNHSGTSGSTSNFLTFGLFGVDNVLNINGSANVGIGTTNPGYKLDVNGTARASTFLLPGGFSIIDSAISASYGKTTTWLEMSGHGIFTGSTAYVDLDASTSTFEIRGFNNDTFAKFENTSTANTDRRISFLTNGGNVGIGTASPGTKLEVVGMISYKPSVGNSITLSDDGTYGTSGTGRYTTLGFSANTNGGNRIFAHNTGEDGIFICAATNRAVVIRAGGSGTDHSVFTSAGNFYTNGYITNIRGNASVSAPSTSDHSLGTRITLYDSTATAWYAIGIESDTMWFNSDNQYKWYVDAVQRMILDSSGNLTASGNITAQSDRKAKKNILTIENALKKVLNLRGVKYNKIEDNSAGIGVIAQEVEEIIPEVVMDGKDGFKSVAYGNMVGLLIEAIKEQQKQIDELKSKLGV